MGGREQRRLRRTIEKLFKVKVWQLILILLLLGFLAATLLRFDHIKMSNLRTEVLAADESGDDAAAMDALNRLRVFTAKHIIFNVVEQNGQQYVTFGTGPLYLEHTYERKAQEVIEKAKAYAETQNGVNPNGNIYKQVADICDARSRQYGWGFNSAYINCFQEELAKYESSGELASDIKAEIPNPELYKYEFASPYWCFCLSGVVILICILLGVVICIRVLIWIFYRILLIIS